MGLPGMPWERGVIQESTEQVMRFRPIARFCATLTSLIFAATVASAAVDAPSDPATKPIVAFHEALLDSMKQAKQLGVTGRYNRLKPVIERTFDLQAMTSAAVGADFASLSPADQHALVEAFERMTVASYAHNFDGYSGERFTMDPNVQERGDHKLVQTMLVVPNDKPHAFNYVLHPVGGTWKVIDILLEGYVSQAATKRSDFSATVAKGGAKALVTRLNTISDGLLTGA
jgi:phospholipid transport system substrate-binding protein